MKNISISTLLISIILFIGSALVMGPASFLLAPAVLLAICIYYVFGLIHLGKAIVKSGIKKTFKEEWSYILVLVIFTIPVFYIFKLFLDIGFFSLALDGFVDMYHAVLRQYF